MVTTVIKTDSTGLDVRPPVPAELDQFFTHHDRIYGRRTDPQLPGIWRNVFDYERSLIARRHGRLVATAGRCAARLRTPGGALPAVVLSYLAVDASERRRGVSVELLHRQYVEAIEREEPVAAFATSFGYQYARIGAGTVAWSASVALDNGRAQLLTPPVERNEVEIATGTVDAALVDGLHGLYTEATASRAGTLEFPVGWWRAYHAETELGDSARFALLASRTGRPSGYAIFTVIESWPDGIPGNVVTVQQLIATDEVTRAALWERVQSMDLAATTLTGNIPVDDSLRWLLREPRELRIRGQRDILWARLLDLPAALRGRRYRGSGSVVVEVADRFLPRNAGCWRLDVSGGEAEVNQTDASPDAAMEIGDLATLFTGAATYHTLRKVGRITPRGSGAELLPALFAVDDVPWSAFVV
jgi:predicted acetyltransferase